MWTHYHESLFSLSSRGGLCAALVSGPKALEDGNRTVAGATGLLVHQLLVCLSENDITSYFDECLLFLPSHAGVVARSTDLVVSACETS